MRNTKLFIIIFTLSFGVFFQSRLAAQQFSFGLRGGWYTGTYKAGGNSSSIFYNGNWEKTHSPSIEFQARIWLGKVLFVQTGVEFYQSELNGYRDISVQNGGVKIQGNISRLSIPVVVGLHTNMNKKVYGFLSGGYAVGKALNENLTASFYNQDFETSLTKGEGGGLAELGCGFHLSKNLIIEVTGKYQILQFTTALQNASNLYVNDWYLRRSMVGLALHYKLNQKEE